MTGAAASTAAIAPIARAGCRLCLYTKTWRSSGTGLIAQELAAALTAAGVEVVFVAPRAEADRFEVANPRLVRVRPPRERTGGAGRLTRAIASASRVVSSALGLLRARLSTRTFLVSIPDPLVFSAPVLGLLKLTGARLIYVVHDAEPHAWRLPKQLRFIERAGFAFIYAIADRLVVLTPAARETLRTAFGVDPARVDIIEHGAFDIGLETPPPGSGALLAFGTLRRNKGIRESIEGVIAARAAGANVHLVIAGEPHAEDRAYWAECEALARTAPEAVKLDVGYIDDSRLADLVGGCDAFLMPYRDFSSQSGVAILALSNGRPLIASRTGGIGALIDDGAPAAVIAEPVDAAAVRDAILAFAARPIGAWSEDARAYRQRMRSERSWARIAEAYIALAFAEGSATQPS